MNLEGGRGEGIVLGSYWEACERQHSSGACSRTFPVLLRITHLSAAKSIGRNMSRACQRFLEVASLTLACPAFSPFINPSLPLHTWAGFRCPASPV